MFIVGDDDLLRPSRREDLFYGQSVAPDSMVSDRQLERPFYTTGTFARRRNRLLSLRPCEGTLYSRYSRETRLLRDLRSRVGWVGFWGRGSGPQVVFLSKEDEGSIHFHRKTNHDSLTGTLSGTGRAGPETDQGCGRGRQNGGTRRKRCRHVTVEVL